MDVEIKNANPNETSPQAVAAVVPTAVAGVFSVEENAMGTQAGRVYGRWTTVPVEWAGHRLYDWQRGGLRSQGNVLVRPARGRARKTFHYHQGTVELTALAVGGDRRLLYRVKALAPGETWPVYERSGKFWSRRYYLVPAAALATARDELAGEAGEQLAAAG